MHINVNLRDLIFSLDKNDAKQIDEKLRQTLMAQCSLFVIEYALARLWMSWGIQPAAMIGHSIGEYVAACISGVLSLDDALMLRDLPGIYCAGEMLDWEAPTGGYLLTACFATGRWAGRAIASRLE